MSNQELFNKTKLATKNINITAINITGRNLITGEADGTLNIYDIKKSQLLSNSKTKLKSKIDKICIPKSFKAAFVLSGGDVYFINIPQVEKPQQVLKSKDIANIYLNLEDKKCEKMLLTLENRGKLAIKIYEFSIGGKNVGINEKKMIKELYLDKLPDYAFWTFRNCFIYSLNNTICYWLNCDTGIIEKTDEDYPNTLEIANLYEREVVTTNLGPGLTYTIFSEKGKSYAPVYHTMPNFHCFCIFENHSLALYDEGVVVFKPGEKEYVPVETIRFDKGETGKFMVASKYKLIAVTSSEDQFNFIDIHGKPFEEKIKVLIDQKEYNKALDILIENISEDSHEERQAKLEEYYLDCAWACIDGNKKDFETSIKYLSVANFNPFEFVYMFCDVLKVNIIHEDKEEAILGKKRENQLVNQTDSDEKQKVPLKYLVTILKMKRDYILEMLIKLKDESDTSLIEFMSSNKSKINLKSSNKQVTIGQTFYLINSSLIKCMIKLRVSPNEIEEVLNNETINYTDLTKFGKEPFFSDEKIKNLNETKFALSYIDEKYENNYDKVLEQYEKFGKGEIENYCIIGKERTKKVFYKFKETKDESREEKEKLFKKYIIWLLEKYSKEAFEVIIKTDLISNKILMEEILPNIKSSGEDIKEIFLEYCNENHKTEIYQTQLMQLYLDKLFNLTGKEKQTKKLEGNAKNYYQFIMAIINSKDSVFDKKLISEYIENSWLKKPKIYLYSQLKEHDKALNELSIEAKLSHNFEEIEKYCKDNVESKPNIFQNFYKLLSELIKSDYQNNIDKILEEIDKIEKKLISSTQENMTESEKKEYNEQIIKLKGEIKNLDELKKPYEDEMLRILKNYGSIQNLDPLFALNYANEHINICENNDFFNYLSNVITEFTEERNKYKITKNLSEVSSFYKEKEALEFKNKYVIIDSNKICGVCKKKIGNTVFVIYPDLKIYHSRCVKNINIDPITGVDFSKKKCVK